MRQCAQMVRKWGKSYLQYAERVPRWIPRKALREVPAIGIRKVIVVDAAGTDGLLIPALRATRVDPMVALRQE